MAGLTEKTRLENRAVEGWLLYYHDRKKEHEQRRQDILNANPGTSLVDISGTRTGLADKTGDRANKLADLSNTEKWLKFIEEIENYLALEQKVFLQLRREYRYCKGRKGWTSAVSYRFCEEMARRVGEEHADRYFLHRNTLTARWQEIVDEVSREALRQGLLP